MKLVDGDYSSSRAVIHAQGNGGSVEALWVGSGGSVGMGTTNPQSKLDVVGTVNAAAFQGDGSGLTGIGAAAIADGGVGDTELANRSVTSAKVALGSLLLENLASEVVNRLVPAGTVVAFAGSTPPSGWLLCDGALAATLQECPHGFWQTCPVVISQSLNPTSEIGGLQHWLLKR